MTYPIEYRRKVLAVRNKENLTIPEVASRFCVGVATVVRWIKRLKPQKVRYKPATKIDRIALIQDVREYPDAYLYERSKRLSCSIKRRVSCFKKNRCDL